MVKTAKKIQKVAHIITATFNYGPFKTQATAKQIRTKIDAAPGTTVSAIVKGAKGYTFKSQTKIGASTATDKMKAVALIRKHAPSAKITSRTV